MPTSSIIHKRCPVCGKLAVELRSKCIGTLIKLITYECGHVVTEKIVKEKRYEDFTSVDGTKRPYAFQIEGMHLAERSGFRHLNADEMGLGKTIQALLPIRAHGEKLTPYLILCKSGLRIQMMKMVLEWLGDEYLPQVIDSTDSHFMRGIKGYIVSLDLLRRIKNGKKLVQRQRVAQSTFDTTDMEKIVQQDDQLATLIKELGIKYVIIDECQLIKNNESQRTSAVRSICENVEHVAALSGTPIKNHAGEYFPILNILRPEKFPRKSHFEYKWVDTYWDGYKYKVGGLKHPEEFKDYTKDFIIRRTRNEVLPDLPNISRNFEFHEMGEEVEQLYASKYKEFQDEYFYGEGTSFEKAGNLLKYISEMRHITGMAKIEPCLDYITEFMMDTDRKITIFVHHIDVATSLQLKIDRLLSDGGYGYKCLRLEGGMDANKKDEVVTNFTTGVHRILIASTLASGEGLNLQQCSDCIMLERQWNPANEEQAECRFIRIGQLADKVTATYMIAVGTVDEFFTELVERKRQIVKGALDGSAPKWDETSLMRELAEVLATKGGKKWGW